MPDETNDKPASATPESSETSTPAAEPTSSAGAEAQTAAEGAPSAMPALSDAPIPAPSASSEAQSEPSIPAADASSATRPVKPAKKTKSKGPDAETGSAAAQAAPPVTTDGPSAASDATEGFLFPAAPTFKPNRLKLRDVILVLVPGVLLWLLMAFHGDVTNPRGEDPGHPLSHYATLLHSGHIPGGVIIGFVLVVLMTLGLLGVLGDSPLDLRGDELARGSDKLEPHRPFWRREGTWLVGFCVLLYVPLAGAYGLWDPWETHYSEVAREILARDDWITLWWGQEGWFMSKPILIFWMAALGMGFGSTFGLPFWRDMGPSTHEWYIRLPIIFLAIGAVYAIYRAVSRSWGRRAGLISGMVLATMPHWCFLAHQAMTDMPFVAPLVIAMAFLIMAVVVDPEKLVDAHAIKLFGRTFRISFWHLAVGAIVMVALPQVMYLLSRPMLLGCPEDADRSCQAVLTASRIGPIQWPIEEYWSGSAGNSVYHDVASTVPGSPAWEDRFNQIPFMTSVVQGLLWVALGAFLLFSFRRERRAQPLSFAMVYLFGAISFMGKGPAGLGVPEVVLLGFMITTGRWKLLPRIRFLQAIGIFLLCGFPWYIGIYCRLGAEFFDRFVVHDLLNRAFAGVHGDTGTFRYFVWQLGYAMFPWTGLVPAALVGWKLFIPEHATQGQKDTARLALLWFMVTFTLFSLMVTKFHHYIFPAVPSVAVLVGLLLHRMLGSRRLGHTPAGLTALGATFVGVALLVFGITNFFGGWSGAVQHEAPFHPAAGNLTLAIVLTLVGVAALLFAWFQSSTAEVDVEGVSEGLSEDTPYMRKYGGVGLGAVGIGAAVLLALVARDIGIVNGSRPAGFERFIHLFIYNYERPFPTHSYDYHAILTGFGVVSVVCAILLANDRTRRHGVRMMVALSACFGFWALDKYMIDLSHHWSQRDLFVRYYNERGTRTSLGVGEDARYWADPIAAFQMNWKGENFYTGNHAAMLECGLPLCREQTHAWMERHRGQHVYFVTELGRAGGIVSQVNGLHSGQARRGNGEPFARTLTDEFNNNKFCIVEAYL